ncbi:hypothetical protein Dimus_006230 [Dionaea muscipula]
MNSLYGLGVPRIKYLRTHRKIYFIELGLVNEIWINCDDVPDNFPTIIRYILKNVIVGFEGCQSTREDVLAIDPLRYQVHCYRQFLSELNELKLMYDCGVTVPSFFDWRRIVCIEDYRIRLNLSSKLGLRSHNLDLDKLEPYWNVCRTLPDLPTDVLAVAANIAERIENLSSGDFMHPYDDEEDQDW